jgi:NAD(P)-dependent dehydrogenase (short-subunit alcohol dehydrogenase family)
MGLSYAQALASAGANIAALDSNSPDERLDQIAVQYGVTVVFHKTNVTNAEEVNAVILKVEERLGSVDIWYFVLSVSA